MADRRTAEPPRLAGRFGYSIIRRSRPRTLATWRVTGLTPHTAQRLATLLGGYPQPDPVTGQVEIVTTTDSIDILLCPDALNVRWERGTRHSCDGSTQSDGRPCVCPATFEQRRAQARQGRGCLPRAEVRFRLQKARPLGVFSFAHEDRSYVGLILATQATLGARESDRAVRARLDLRRTLHRLSSGRELAYTRPVITLVENDQAPTRRVAAQVRKRR